MIEDINSFESVVRNYIRREQLLRPDGPVIVTLSGGADSVALLAVLTALGYDCRAAHCNFHLRGEESMRDMAHAAGICNTLGVDLYVKDFDVPARQAATGESVEMACRELRYKWFADLVHRERAQAIAVGHHQEDRIETFMLNLARGTGIRGLVSMRPRNQLVVRPLLCVCREDIETYLHLRGLEWIVDSSNNSDEHRRNRVRRHVMPTFERHFLGVDASILTTVSNLEAAESLYQYAVDNIIKATTDTAGIDLEALARYPESATVLFEYLRPRGFNMAQVENILADTTVSGRRYLSADGRYVAELSRQYLRVSDATSAVAADEVYPVDLRQSIFEPVRIDVSYHPVTDFHPEDVGPVVAYIDAAATGPAAEWQLRHARRGDTMVPFGRRRGKLLSDIFCQAKYTAAQKREAWLLTRNGEIVWIPGLRCSGLFAIGPDTKEYIRLELK
ncbi:MAG: tRNA lysidine(34) synthetase TilS [Muribaculaceae bacterium]|nr:tRNA lysidine(34) synthetase TilS [Muribaculaceae bacterium]